jgi:hypothetical protein
MVMPPSIEIAASRPSGAEGTGGPVGLEVMPIDSVTLSDAYDPGERTQSAVLVGDVVARVAIP